VSGDALVPTIRADSVMRRLRPRHGLTRRRGISFTSPATGLGTSASGVKALAGKRRDSHAGRSGALSCS
jgi:hypothetical protein